MIACRFKPRSAKAAKPARVTAVLSRHGVTFARMSSRTDGRLRVLTGAPMRRIKPGKYTITLSFDSGGRIVRETGQIDVS